MGPKRFALRPDLTIGADGWAYGHVCVHVSAGAHGQLDHRRTRPARAAVVTTTGGEHALDAFRSRRDDLLGAFDAPLNREPRMGGATTIRSPE